MTNFIFCLLTIAFSATAGFVMTYLLSLKNKKQYDGETEEVATMKDNAEERIKEIDLFQLCEGQVIPMEKVSDPVFSQKMMGDGYAVKPTDSAMYSPVFGVISTIFETQHAIGIRTENGLDILVHMGIDTVSLKGEPFEILVAVGESVTEKTPIANVELEKIAAAGKSDEMIVVVTNMIDVKEFDYEEGLTGHQGDLVVTIELN